jgi:hypothetical protein
MDNYEQNNAFVYRATKLFCLENTKHNLVYAYGADAPSRAKLASFAIRNVECDKYDDFCIYIYHDDELIDTDADLIIINEIQTIPESNLDFETMLDAYISKQKRVFITSDRHPLTLQNISASMKNNIASNFVIADFVEPPKER